MEINNSSKPEKDFMWGIAPENPKKGGGKNCSWCYNGCKNRKVYTSHYMKNKRGEITCPKLLKSICRNCGKTGHVMGKFCLEARKPDELLLKPCRRFFIDRMTSDVYCPGDSEYFPLSSDDESDDEQELRRFTDEQNAQELRRIADEHYPQITTNATQSVRTFLRPKLIEPPKPVQSWASKLFTKT